MTKQQEIRKDAIIITKNQLRVEGMLDEQRLAVTAIQIVAQIFSSLDSEGVVIRVNKELPFTDWGLEKRKGFLAAIDDGYRAVEPLIKDDK